MGKPQHEWVGFVACIFFVGIDARCLAQSQSDKINDSAGGGTSLVEVVVTGSRIPTAIADETLPITILDAKDLARGGSDSLGKILQKLPMSATSVLNTNVNNGGNGSARVDLRSLKPKRTLVLLNGHRLPNGGIGGDDSVDLNSLPQAMIDRVEISTSGASAIYGADAVAGVVNFITKSSYDGIDLRAEQSESGEWDGQITNLSLALGHDLFGGQWMLGAEYVNQRPVLQSERAYSAIPSTLSDFNGDKVPFGSQTIPEGVFGVPPGNALGLPPGPYTRVSGSSGRTAADFRPLLDSDVFNYAPYSYLQTPNERGSVWLMGTQPLLPQVSLHVEGLWNHRRSSQALAPTPFTSVLDLAPMLADGSSGIPATNYYNPFGVDLERVRRRFVEIGSRQQHQQVDIHRELAALSIQIGSWKVEPAVSFSHSSASETDGGAIPGDRLATAIGPSGPDAQGQIVCGTPGTGGIVPAEAIIQGCVPVDLFGGVGSITSQQLAGLQRPLTDHGTNSQRMASVTAQGPFGAAAGGPIQWASGAEYRREEGSYDFDPNRGGGAVGSGGQSPIPEVAVSTRETYLEMRAPLVRDRPWANAVDAAAGIRYTDSTFGGHFTWQTGIRWQPVPAVTLRTNYARVFRAPSLDELYLVPHAGADLSSDPCGHHPTAPQRANCAANGVPGGEYVQDPRAAFVVFSGGNTQLAPESGYSFDSGIDWRPAALPGFHASLDAYQIDLQGDIETPDAGTLLQQCADGGLTGICSLIRRAADGSLVAVSTLPRNFGHNLTRGFDLASAFNRQTGIGQMKISLQATYLARFDTQLIPGGDTSRQAGGYSPFAYALPRWRALASMDLTRGPWLFSYSAQWIGGFSECGGVDFVMEDQIYCRRVQGVVYHDIEAGLVIHSALTLRLGVTNLTDQQPPFLNFGPEANTDPSIYRLLGRTFFAAVRYQLH